MERTMKDCECEVVKIYDGEHRCMICFEKFTKTPGENMNMEYEIAQEIVCTPSDTQIGTRRSDNLPLGVNPNES